MTDDVVLENALVVHHDHVRARSLSFSGGVVAAGTAADATHIDLRDHLIFPGLINAHDHLQLNAIPPLVHAQAFGNSYEWIDDFESHLLRPDVLAATRVLSAVRHWHGGLKNVLAGVTTVAHHDPSHIVFEDPCFPVNPLRNAHWCHSLGLGEARNGRAPRYGPSVHESYCATPHDQPWIIHLAEGTDDVAATELARLATMGCLSSNTVLVHGVGLTKAGVERVVDCGAAVVWCPASNVAMLGRTLDARRLFDAGRLALGSDSRLTGSRDLLDELRMAAMNSDLSPSELLQLVTADASRVLRIAAIGALEEGRYADCLIVHNDGDPYDALLRTTRSTIRAVVRGGIPVIADPDFSDWFAHCGIATVAVRLDGRVKLMSERLVKADAIALEPGLELL